MFLEQQIIILERFLKDHVTEDWSNDAENTAQILKYIQTENNFKL